MSGDWLRLYRKSLDSRVFSDDWLWRLWCWCLIKANWKPCWRDGREILAGQFAVTRTEAAEELGVGASRWYRGIQTLSDWGQIRVEVNNRFSVVTICNWETYQNEGGEPRTTGEQQMNNQRTTGEHLANNLYIREEGKKERPPLTPQRGEIRGCAVDALDPLFDRFWRAYPVHKAAMAARRVWDKLNVDEPLLEEMLRAIAVQKKSEQWQNPRMIPKPSNWLNDDCWKDEPMPSLGQMEEIAEQRAERQRKQKEALKIDGPAVPIGEVLKRVKEKERINDDSTGNA